MIRVYPFLQPTAINELSGEILTQLAWYFNILNKIYSLLGIDHFDSKQSSPTVMYSSF